jgi:hypothetical protein
MEPGRHTRLTSTPMLKRWLLLLPILLCATVAWLLAVADSTAAYVLVVGALVGGTVSALAVLPVGEGRPGPPWWTLFLGLLWLPGVSIVAGRTGVPYLFVVYCAAVAVMTYAVVAGLQIVRRREISWRSIVDAPWRP